MFDGSTVVNLHALILQLRPLTKYRSRRKAETLSAIAERLDAIFSLEKSVPAFDYDGLELFGRGLDDPLQGLELSLDRLAQLKEVGEIDDTVIANITELGMIILEELDAHDTAIAQSKFEFGHDQSPELFEIAKKYCTLHAAACCLHMWLYNRHHLGEFFAKGEWLALSLHRLLKTCRPLPYTLTEKYVESVAHELLKLHKEAKLFSIVPVQLAQSTPSEDRFHATSGFPVHA
jgi:hypothetical protein